MTDSLIFFLKTEASPLCREVTVSYSITETVQVAVSFPLDDVMPWFPGHPKSAGWNLNSFGLVSSDGWKVNEPVFSSVMAMLHCPCAPIRDLN